VSKLNGKGYSLLFEVADSDGETTYGGESPVLAIQWFRQSPAGSRLYVTAWDGNEVESQPLGPAIDLTELVGAVRGGWIW
jgi:hypothetical protein